MFALHSRFARIFDRVVEVKEYSGAHIADVIQRLDADLAGHGIEIREITGIREHARVRLENIQELIDDHQAYVAGLGGEQNLLTPAIVAGLAFEYGRPALTAQRMGTWFTALRDDMRAVVHAANAALPAEFTAQLTTGPEEPYNGEDINAAFAAVGGPTTRLPSSPELEELGATLTTVRDRLQQGA